MVCFCETLSWKIIDTSRLGLIGNLVGSLALDKMLNVFSTSSVLGFVGIALHNKPRTVVSRLRTVLLL